MRSSLCGILTISLFLASSPAAAGAASLTAFWLNHTSVTGGYPATGTVSLTGLTQVDRVVVLSSGRPEVAAVPAALLGKTMTTSFTITTKPVATPTDVVISATLGGVTKAATLRVLPIAIYTIDLAPYIFPGGTPIKGKVGLTGPAPPGGAIVTLVSDKPAVAAVPGFVQVAAGSLEAVFDIVTVPVAQFTAVTFHASYFGDTGRQLTVRPPAPSGLTFSPSNSVIGGTSVTATLALDGPAPPGGAAFEFKTSMQGYAPAATPVPVTVTVPAGASQASFTVTTKPVAQSVQVDFSIRNWPGGPFQLQVLAPALKEVGFNPATVSYQAGFADGWVSLTGPAPPVGAVVLLSWSNTVAATAPPSVSVAAGATAASFKVTTKPVTQPSPFTISAYNGGVTKTVTLMVTP